MDVDKMYGTRECTGPTEAEAFHVFNNAIE